MPRLSCITTVHDEGIQLFTAVNAVLAQSHDDFEFLIVDDGSAAETKALLAGLDDPRIRRIEQSNDGLSSARNIALQHARGDYLCFLDADDSRPDWAFAAIVEQLDRDDPDLLLCPGVLSLARGAPHPFFDTVVFDLIGALLPDGSAKSDHPDAETIWSLAQLIEPQSANKVIRRDLVERYGLCFPPTHFFEDIFFHSMALAAAERVSFASSPCFAYHRHYGRPQITSDSGMRRFDLLAVARLTLESAAAPRWIERPLYRSAVLASCLKLAEWCEHSISHSHKAAFRQEVRALVHCINRDGDITRLCNGGEYWSPRSKADAISDIESRTHSYFVDRAGYRTDIHVVNEGGKKYLRTYADQTSQNNLDNLPDC